MSFRSAARVRGLGHMAADVMEFTIPRRRQTRRTDVRLHRGTVTADDWSLVDGLPVNTASRVVDDLAGERIDRGHLAGLVRDALSREQISTAILERVLSRHARGYGVQAGMVPACCGECLDPVLSGRTVSGRWDSIRRRWAD